MIYEARMPMRYASTLKLMLDIGYGISGTRCAPSPSPSPSLYFRPLNIQSAPDIQPTENSQPGPSQERASVALGVRALNAESRYLLPTPTLLCSTFCARKTLAPEEWDRCLDA